MQGSELGRWLLRHAVLALAVLVVAKGNLVAGIRCDDGLTLVAVVVLISLLNSLLRPMLLLVAMPLVIASFGLLLLPALWIANATVLYLVGHSLGLRGFHVDTFGAAMWASLWISIIALILGKMLGGSGTRGTPAPGTPASRKKAKPDDTEVIDV
jgi:putative membrane protein